MATKHTAGEVTEPQYPEHEKLHAIKSQSEPIGQFLEEMSWSGVELCKFDERLQEYRPLQKPINTILAEHFGIDLVKLEAEKQAMLDELRAAAIARATN